MLIVSCSCVCLTGSDLHLLVCSFFCWDLVDFGLGSLILSSLLPFLQWVFVMGQVWIEMKWIFSPLFLYFYNQYNVFFVCVYGFSPSLEALFMFMDSQIRWYFRHDFWQVLIIHGQMQWGVNSGFIAEEC